MAVQINRWVDQEWPITLPEEPPRDRPLIARGVGGETMSTWLYQLTQRRAA